jgi:hypothetical protein
MSTNIMLTNIILYFSQLHVCNILAYVHRSYIRRRVHRLTDEYINGRTWQPRRGHVASTFVG